MVKQVFHIEGVTCHHCVAKVKNALEGQQGVQKVEVSRNDDTVTLTADPMPELAQLNNILEDYGNYKLSNL
ncbi:MAG: heavy-metal-associated domain-containing protein [Bacteroidota bacterium]